MVLVIKSQWQSLAIISGSTCFLNTQKLINLNCKAMKFLSTMLTWIWIATAIGIANGKLWYDYRVCTKK